MSLLPHARRFHLTFERFAGHHNFDRQIWRNLMSHKIPLSFFKFTPLLFEQEEEGSMSWLTNSLLCLMDMLSRGC